MCDLINAELENHLIQGFVIDSKFKLATEIMVGSIKNSNDDFVGEHKKPHDIEHYDRYHW